MNVKELDKEYVASSYGRFPLQIVKGKGSIVEDENGKKYIDLATGIAVNALGVANDKWIAAVTKQLGLFQHTSNLYYTEPCVKLAELLCKKSGKCFNIFKGNTLHLNIHTGGERDLARAKDFCGFGDGLQLICGQLAVARHHAAIEAVCGALVAQKAKPLYTGNVGGGNGTFRVLVGIVLHHSEVSLNLCCFRCFVQREHQKYYNTAHFCCQETKNARM